MNTYDTFDPHEIRKQSFQFLNVYTTVDIRIFPDKRPHHTQPCALAVLQSHCRLPYTQTQSLLCTVEITLLYTFYLKLAEHLWVYRVSIKCGDTQISYYQITLDKPNITIQLKSVCIPINVGYAYKISISAENLYVATSFIQLSYYGCYDKRKRTHTSKWRLIHNTKSFVIFSLTMLRYRW